MSVTWPEGDVLGRTGAAWESLLIRGVNVVEFGAVGDARQVSDAAMTSGLSVVTSATAAFTTADVGKAITIQHAISATVSNVTTITAVLSATQVTVATPAAVSVSGKQAVIGTNNNAAFAATLTYAGAATVYVPAGTYLFQSALTFNVANQTIIGARGATLLSDGSIVRPFQFNTSGIEWQNLTFDGNWAAAANPTNTGNVLFLANTAAARNNYSLQRCTLKNAPQIGLQSLNSNHVKIQNCTVQNIGVQAINATASIAGVTDYLVENNLIDNSTVDGSLPCPDPGNGSGIGVGGGVGSLISRVRIIGNTVICPSSASVTLSGNSQGIIGGLKNGVIANNTVEGSRICYSPAASAGLAFTGNTAKGGQDYGFEFPGCTYVACTGNACDGDGITTDGIIFDGVPAVGDAAYSTITGNSIYNMGVAGGSSIATANSQEHHLIISGNYAESSLGQAISIRTTDKVSIFGNTVVNVGTATSGVRLDNCEYVNIQGNTIVGAFTNPIFLVESAPVTRTRLTVIGNVSDNAQTVVKSANLTIGAGCRIHSNSLDAALTTI